MQWDDLMFILAALTTVAFPTTLHKIPADILTDLIDPSY